MDNIPRSAKEYRQWWAEQKPDIPYGECWCGCGQQTTIASTTAQARGWINGEPIRYRRHHQSRLNDQQREALIETRKLQWTAEVPGIPYGYCHCGCGKKTRISPTTHVNEGCIKGEPLKYLREHQFRLNPDELEAQRIAYKETWQRERPNIPYGLCWCGCGKKTKIADRHSTRTGYLVGEPRRFIHQHAQTKYPPDEPSYTVENRGYKTPCWIWRRRFGKNGYPLMNIPGVQHYPAHRYYHEQRYGPMPKTYITHHFCRVHSCVNPEHTAGISREDHRVIHAVLDMNEEKALAIGILKANGFGLEATCRLFNLSRPVIEAIPTINPGLYT